MERAEIELVEEVDPALAAAEVERAPDKRGRRKAKTALDLKPDMTTDSLQLFLKDISKVPGDRTGAVRDRSWPSGTTLPMIGVRE